MLKELIKKNRSYRRFTQDAPVSKDELLSYVDAARFAASAGNKQLLRYRLISGSECEKAFPFTAWAAMLKDWGGPSKHERPTGYILICSDKNQPSPECDIGIAAQTISLLACENNRACCMLGALRRDELRESLGIPENLIVRLAIAIGTPGETVIIEECVNKENTGYYRTPDNIHHVPKLKLADIILD